MSAALQESKSPFLKVLNNAFSKRFLSRFVLFADLHSLWEFIAAQSFVSTGTSGKGFVGFIYCLMFLTN